MWIRNSSNTVGWAITLAVALLLSACAEREEPYVTPDWDLRMGEDCFVEVRAHPSLAGPKIAVRAERAAGEATRSRLAPDGLAVHGQQGTVSGPSSFGTGSITMRISRRRKMVPPRPCLPLKTSWKVERTSCVHIRIIAGVRRVNMMDGACMTWFSLRCRKPFPAVLRKGQT